MYHNKFKAKASYVVLFLGLVAITLLFFAVWPNRLYQRGVILILSLFYFLWGLITHLKSDKISRQVILEYFSVSLLAGLLLLLVTI